ncbi:sulfatase family protein [Sediminitomix flava]|uniref:Arylsulfatase A-like enzyme n=1 Tax=Sediminitomix flava TaxID=379075 RepID=A0A315ZB27_SEDFL|nr:sulfatase-like hydrolase/transferase [Sediminitomix flava]PWJ41924.1 arylsulfatase A-like enzyme [Sediminitomix flava]
MKKISFLTILTYFIFLHCSYSQGQERPNILVITADDLGYGDLSSYGAQDIKSPNIDQIAQKGILFTNFHTTSSVCSPSRASMLTGKSPDKVGVPGVVRHNSSNSFGYLSENVTTIGDLFKDQGYQTAMIGKWHLGDEAPNLPNDRGFEFYKGWLVGMTDYYKHERYGQNWMRENKTPIVPEGHVTDIFTDWTIDFIKEKRNEPFCLFLNYTAPHSPLQPRQDYLDKVLKENPNIDEDRAKYVGLVEHMDKSIGDIISTLEDTGQLKNTLILFLSDNGGALRHAASNANLKGQKGDMYEGGVRVPLIAMWEGQIQANQKTDHYAAITDLYPTLATAAQISEAHWADGIDGINQMELFKEGTPTISDRTVFYMRRGNNSACVDGTICYAIQKGKWKLVQNSACEPFVFYDMIADPEETNPIPTDKMPKKFKNFQKEMRKHLVKVGATPWARPAQ